MTDDEYDSDRAARKGQRLSLAERRGETLRAVEDALAALQISAFDRRMVRERLAVSRLRLGW